MANPKRTRFSPDLQTRNKARDLDKLAELDEYHNSVLPKLRRMLEKGESADKMYSAFQSLIAAKVISKAMTTEDSDELLRFAKEMLDRGTGKPKESFDITSRYEKLSDAELDSLVKSKQEELAEDESEVQD